MKIIKIIVITLIVVSILIVGIFVALFSRVPSRISRLFNQITIEEAIKLTKDCQIQSVGEPHIGGIVIVLNEGSSKFLDGKYSLFNHLKVQDKNNEQLFQLVYNSKARCGYQIKYWIE